MSEQKYSDQSLFRRCLSTYLVAVPWGRWPEFSAQTKAGRRRILKTRSTQTLLVLFLRTNLWYLRYIYQYLTSAIRKEPTFFLLGFPKCGTTYLAELLTSLDDVGHPTWLAPLSKETVHYRKDQAVHHFMPIRGFYPIFSRANHIVDASVSYVLDPNAVSLASQDYPDAKVLLVVRDQVKGFESGINYYNVRLWRPDPSELDIFNDPQTYRDFPMEKAERIVEYSYEHRCSIVVASRSKEIQDMLGDDAPIANRFAPMLYDMWLQCVYEKFGEGNIRVLDFAELITDPVAALRETTEFVGIRTSAKDFELNTDKLNKHASEKVFRLNAESKTAIRERFLEHNEKLKVMSDVDLDQYH